jgi:cell division protease FtsH
VSCSTEPDLKGREAIPQSNTRGKPVSPEVSLEEIARATPALLALTWKNLVNEAAILAARRNMKDHRSIRV